MPQVTITDIRERIEAIFAAATDDIVTVITTDDEECYLTEDQLPAVLVNSRGGSGQRTSSDRRLRTRVFEITVFFTLVCDDSTAEQFRAYAEAEDRLEMIPDILDASGPNLRLNGDNGLQGLSTAQPVPEPTDRGPGYAEWGGGVYMSAVYSLPITFNRV